MCEVELWPPWGYFSVSGHLHTHRGHVQSGHGKSLSKQKNAHGHACMHMNLALQSLLISHEYEHQAKPHADFGIWLGLVPACICERQGETDMPGAYPPHR